MRTNERELLGFILLVVKFSIVHDSPLSASGFPTRFGGRKIRRSGSLHRIQSHKSKSCIFPARQPVGKRRNRVVTVPFEIAKIAVMQEDNIAAGDSPQAMNDGSGGLRLPVPGPS